MNAAKIVEMNIYSKKMKHQNLNVLQIVLKGCLILEKITFVKHHVVKKMGFISTQKLK